MFSRAWRWLIVFASPGAFWWSMAYAQASHIFFVRREDIGDFERIAVSLVLERPSPFFEEFF